MFDMSLDYRDKENRLDSFKKYWAFMLATEDYDPAYYTMNYLKKRFNMSIEQTLWFCWLYGFIYNTGTAWVVMNKFPEYLSVNIDSLKDWENDNYKNLIFEVDTRHKKGKIHIAFEYYKDTVGESQYEFFKKVCCSSDKKENFRKLWNIVINWKLFGRYSAYFYIETLQKVAGLPIECDSLMLRDSGSKSHRNGLCYVLGKDEWQLGSKFSEFKGYTSEQFEYLEEEADKIMNQMIEEYPKLRDKIEYFTFETVLCAYKGFFRGKRYPGFYLDRDAQQIKKISEKWPSIDWNVFWECRKENLIPELCCENYGIYSPDPNKQKEFMKSGKMVNMDILDYNLYS